LRRVAASSRIREYGAVTRIVLASASPRRKELLSDLGINAAVVPSSVEEMLNAASPASLVRRNARAKRDDVAARITGPAVVIAADTLVFLRGQVLAKPVNLDEARAMLRRLSGKTHQVVTGVAVCDTARGRKAEGHETTKVTFRRLSSREIDRFVDAVRPLDRAGAYTVDGPGSLLVRRYDGCFQNVLGLPIGRLDAVLRRIGLSLFDLMDPARARFL
jgi:septum formation protein